MGHEVWFVQLSAAEQASLNKLNHFASTSVGFKATKGRIQKGQILFPLSVCFLSLALDEEESGAKLL